MPEYAWYFENDSARMVRVVTRSGHASMIEFNEQGVVWQILVSNDDIEFIGDRAVDDNED